MMSKTHITMGVAVSMLVTHPESPETCLLSIAGGAIGGVLADIDTLKNDSSDKDALIGQLISLGVSVVVFALDYFLNLGTCRSIALRDKTELIIGLVIYIGLWVVGFITKHRTFTHTLLATILFSAAIYMICPQLLIPFAAGYLTHLLLDLLNKKDIQLFFPLKPKFCFKLCYAAGTANTVLMFVGLGGSVFLVLNSLLFKLF